tara:strand:+ start:231 stop:434 length:204 start_codon:yes stop_codon:yes gene_type:complete
MREHKTNYTVYSDGSRMLYSSADSKAINIQELIKRSKQEKLKEKVFKFYLSIGLVGVIFLSGLWAYL